MKNNKGITFTIIVVILVAAVVLEAIAINTFVADTDAIKRAGRELDVIEAIDSMEFLKLALDTSVNYAVQRASYDTLSKGGYHTLPNDVISSGCEPYWRVFENNYVPDDDSLKINLENSIAEVFSCYGSSFSSSYKSFDISMATPDYSSCGEVGIGETRSGYKVSIVEICDYGLTASKKDSVIVSERNANFEDDVKMEYFKLSSDGKTLFENNRPVYNAVQKALSGISCETLSHRGDDCISGSELLYSSCGNWEAILEDSIKAELGEVLVEGAQVTISVNRWNMDYSADVCSCNPVEVEISCDDSVSLDSICPGECLLGGAAECSAYCGSGVPYSCTSEGGCTCCCKCYPATDGDVGTDEPGESESEVCTETKYDTTCSFSYEADVDVTISILGDATYPIYNPVTGNAKETRLELKFRVIDGTLNSMTPDSISCGFSGYC